MASDQKRVAYADAGAAGRAALERACHVKKLTQSDWRTLGAVVALLPLYSKVDDNVYVYQLADFGNLSPRSVRRSLKRLHDEGVIEYDGNRGQGKPGHVSVNAELSVQHAGHTLSGQDAGHTTQVVRTKPADLSGQHAGHNPRSSEKKALASNDEKRARGLARNWSALSVDELAHDVREEFDDGHHSDHELEQLVDVALAERRAT